MSLARYLLFAGDSYYPAGGWKDFQTSHDDVAELKDYFYNADRDVFVPSDWADIVDTHTGKIIEHGWSEDGGFVWLAGEGGRL